MIGEHVLSNASGMEVRFVAYGGIITSIRVPDRNGVIAEVTPGYDTLAEYERDGSFFGALVGRYANRIAGGRFTLDGAEYQLVQNDGENQLHGGPGGFHKLTWRVAPFRDATGTGAVLCCKSAAGDQGFPGSLVTRVKYTLSDANELSIEYTAITDAPTPVNLTQHTYFNLAGADAGTVLDHELWLNSSAFTPVDRKLIPTGEVRDTKGTPFDFTTPRTIGAALASAGRDEQIGIAGGFDHNFALYQSGGAAAARIAARVYEPTTGRVLDIFTTEPGIQFYSGNGLQHGAPGRGGYRYPQYGALALEAQHFPDSPNRPQFASTIVRPGDEYRSRTVWRFSARPADA